MDTKALNLVKPIEVGRALRKHLRKIGFEYSEHPEFKEIFDLLRRVEQEGIGAPDGWLLVKGKPVGYTAQSSLDDLAREECSGVIMGSYSERYHRTIPVYAVAPSEPKTFPDKTGINGDGE